MISNDSFHFGKAKTINRKLISSLSEYLSYVEYLATDANELWFRGVSKASYKLIPGIYRHEEWEYSGLAANDLFYKFIRKAKANLSTQQYTLWEWLQVMQHYGLPTRLLDWTEGALIGLYFAIRDLHANSTPAVWVLEPFWLNQTSVGSNIVFYSDATTQTNEDAIVNNYAVDHDDLPDFPLAVAPAYFSERIAAQKGCFTVHGREKAGMGLVHQKDPESLRLVQLKISGRAVEGLKSGLVRTGITETTLFPDLEGLARELKSEWGMA